jgi:uncharacterized protein
MIIADTGFWLALANQKDKHHITAVSCVEALTERLITTWPVMSETCHLLLQRVGVTAQLSFMQNYTEGAFDAFELTHNHSHRLTALMVQYADLPMDLADASLVVLAEYLGHGRIFSTDRRDFSTYRWKQHQPFENLMFTP